MCFCLYTKISERRSKNANQFSDDHQLFIGNVPHQATEKELKIMFGRFGTVVDLQIHLKSDGPGIRAPQNYGVITYESNNWYAISRANVH